MLNSAEVKGKLDGQPAAKAPNGKPPGQQQADETKNAWRKDGLKPDGYSDRRRPGFRHELASALAILELLHRAQPKHRGFDWPEELKAEFGLVSQEPAEPDAVNDTLVQELAALSADEFDLLLYLVAAHHGKVRMSLRSSPDDDRTNVPDPCPGDKRQARGVRDADCLPSCRIPAADLNGTGIDTHEVILSLDLMELGLSPGFGASWRERTQLLLERLGPFRLAYLEAILRAADCRASAEEDQAGNPNAKGA